MMVDRTACVILVDNSNIFIEAQKSSALRRGIGSVDSRPALDHEYRLDYGSLLAHLAGGRRIIAAVLVGSRPPPSIVWEIAERAGFKVITHQRDATNREKAVDTELVARGMRAMSMSQPAVLVLASGDLDFKPIVTQAHEMGWVVEMAAFAAAYSTELGSLVDRKRLLDGALDLIGHNKASV